MNLKISESVQKSQQFEIPSIALMMELIPHEQIQAVLDTTDKHEERKRKLTAEWVIWLCIVMAWFPRRSIKSVLAKLWQAISLGWENPTQTMASDSAISQARYRLGVKPLELLFKTLCQPLATHETPGAFYQQMRLVAFDGTKENVADSPENAEYFGYNKSQRGKSGYPQLRSVYACELGTHLIFDAVVGSCYRGEHPMACRLIRSIQPDMLVMLDAGLSSFEIVAGSLDKNANVLCRAHASRKWEAMTTLKDGSFLAQMHPPKHLEQHAPLTVRVIRYCLDDEARPHHGEIQMLVTSLLDPLLYPAEDLIMLYHERWEIEIAIDEMDTHQRLANRPFRSLKPVGVLQEFYAFLIAYFLIRLVMLRTATYSQIDPDRLSFTSTIHILTDALPLFQLVNPHLHTRLWHWIHDWVSYFQLPPRRNRSNPRVIKRVQSRFPKKQPHHFKRPPHTKTFREAIVILT